jgi:hypothetical protein
MMSTIARFATHIGATGYSFGRRNRTATAMGGCAILVLPARHAGQHALYWIFFLELSSLQGHHVDYYEFLEDKSTQK